MTTCPGTRRVPIENIKPAPPEWTGTYARRYGIAHCMVCKRWYVAHKDGTPVYHDYRTVKCWCVGEDGEHNADAHSEKGRW